MSKIKDRLSIKQKALFAGRLEEVRQFRNLVSGPRPEFNILVYTGIGGIGKSTMLTMFKDVCDDMGIPFAQVDAVEQQIVISILSSLGQQLRESIETKKFDGLVKRYLEIEHILQANRNIRPEYLSLLSKGGAFGGTRHIIGAGDSNAEFNPDEARRAIYNAIERADAEFFLEPEVEFTAAIVEDINTYTLERSICISLDTYEKISDALDQWFCNLLPQLEDKVLLIICGRTPPKERWMKLQSLMNIIELKPFELQDTAELLALNQISTQEMGEQIQKITGGIPLGIALCIERIKEGKSDILKVSDTVTVVEEIVRSLLRDVNTEIRDMIELCAVLHWFNEDMLKEILDGNDVESIYSKIRQLPFVKPHTDGVKLHDRIRDFVNEDIRHHRPKLYSELHNKAAKYFINQRSNTQSSIDDRRALIEVIYHKIRADEETGIKDTVTIFNDAADLFQADLCEAIFEAVKEAHLSDTNTLWKDYFAGVTAKLKIDNVIAEELLKAVLNKPASYLDTKLRVYAGRWLAGSLWFAGKFDEVIKYGEETLELSKELAKNGVPEMKDYENRALETIGLAWDRLGEFQKGIEYQLALERSSKQVNDRRGEGWAMNNAGYFCWHSGDWDQAELYLKRCLEIAREIKSDYMEVYPLGHLGLVYTGLGEFDSQYYKQARQLLEQCKEKALPATSKEMDCKAHQNLGQLEFALGNYDVAAKHEEIALHLATGMVHPYYEADSLRNWGTILFEEGRVEEATLKFVDSFNISSRIKGRYIQARCMVVLYYIKNLGFQIPVEKPEIFEYDAIMEFLSPFAFYNEKGLLNYYRAKLLLAEKKDEAFEYFSQALVESLRHNRFWCDKIMALIGKEFSSGLFNKRELAEEFRNYTIEFWKTSEFQGKPLIEFEEAKRSQGHINLARRSVLDQLQRLI